MLYSVCCACVRPVHVRKAGCVLASSFVAGQHCNFRFCGVESRLEANLDLCDFKAVGWILTRICFAELGDNIQINSKNVASRDRTWACGT